MYRSEKDEIVERALRQDLLWDSVKDRLDKKAAGISLEEQQKLCLARLLPGSQYTILIVTHNMAQARRASEECIFMLMGRLVEHMATEEMFVTPAKQETADYIEGRYG